MEHNELIQIAKNHLTKNKVDAHHLHLISMMHQALKEGFKLFRSHNTIFTYMPQGTNVYFGIVDGGSPKEFFRACKEFYAQCRNAGFKTATCFTDKPDYARHIMEQCGIKNISYQTHDRQVDPHLMRGDL